MSAFDLDSFDAEAFDLGAVDPAFSTRAFDDEAFDTDVGSTVGTAFSADAFDVDAFDTDFEPIADSSVTFVGLYPVPGLAVGARYVSGAARPLAATYRAPFEEARRAESGWSDGAKDSQRFPTGFSMQYQQGAPARASVASGYDEATHLLDALRGRYQRADGASAAARGQWQEGDRMRRALAGVFQRAARVPVPSVTQGFQQGLRTRHRLDAGFQDALLMRAGVMAEFRIADLARLFLDSRYQDASPVRAGVSEHPVNPPGPVDPEPGETIVVPIRRIYIVQNSISLTRVDGGDIIPADSFAMSIDADSWTWQWSASLPGSSLPLVESVDGQPVDVLATINGVGYRLCVERFSRERWFANSRVRVSGRGRAAILDAPYSPVLNHVGDADMTIAQLLEKVLTINGVGIGWAVDFGVEDWFVPGGTWALQGTYMAGVLDIAGAAGAIVQPHRTAATLRVLPRYPAAPWEWGDVTPDFQLPAAAVVVEGIEWINRPAYNRVFALGTTSSGVAGQVTRAGTAGDVIAPQVTHSLMTHAIGVRQRGLPELANTGRQAQVSLRTQVLPETGIIVPGQFVRYVDGTDTRVGLVRSTSLDWQRPSLRQSITLETHLAEA